MTEQRLKEIKTSINFQITATKAYEYDETLINEELELYNEVVRLRESNKRVIEYIGNGNLRINKKVREKIINILKQNNLTLEQLTGIANN